MTPERTPRRTREAAMTHSRAVLLLSPRLQSAERAKDCGRVPRTSAWFISPLRQRLNDREVREAWQPWLRGKSPGFPGSAQKTHIPVCVDRTDNEAER